MSSESNLTLYDRCKQWLQNNKTFVIIALFLAGLGVIAQGLSSIQEINQFLCDWMKWGKNCNAVTLAELSGGYDFIEHASEATWSNDGSTQLPFPGNRGDDRGFVYVGSYSNEKLENNEVPNKFLEMHPEWESNGILEGKYGPFQIANHLKFQATVGYLQPKGQPDGVIFRLEYRSLSSTNRKVLHEQPVYYDGKLDFFEEDLSSIANSEGYIILSVDAGETSTQDWAIWLDPKIIRQ